MSFRKIADKLNDEKLIARSGKRWLGVTSAISLGCIAKSHPAAASLWQKSVAQFHSLCKKLNVASNFRSVASPGPIAVITFPGPRIYFAMHFGERKLCEQATFLHEYVSLIGCIQERNGLRLSCLAFD